MITDLLKTYFQVENLEEITQERISTFFQTERVESDRLEFKSGGTSNFDSSPQIKKSICAFLNTDGGILIWGAPVGRMIEGKTEKVFTGEVQYVSEELENDLLINKIADSMEPLAAQVRVHRIGNNEKFIYVFAIGKSEYSPHRLCIKNDNNFYMRLYGQTRKAPYQFVEALFKKIKFPNLHGYISSLNINFDRDEVIINFSALFVNMSPLQNDKDLVYQIQVSEGVFKNYNGSFNDKGESYISKKIKHQIKLNSILHYGNVNREYQSLKFSKAEVLKGTEPIPFSIELAFGAAKSPLKVSVYNYELYLFRNEPHYSLKSKVENQMYSEKNDTNEIMKDINRFLDKDE